MEVITACDNLCRDWNWLAPTASVLADIGTFLVGIGVVAAFRQVNLWRVEAKSRSKAETAQMVLVAVANVDDALKQIRSPFDRIPIDELGVGAKLYERRYQRIVDKSDVFNCLRDAQIHQDALIGKEVVSKSIDELFDVRRKVVLAIEFLAESDDENDSETRSLKVKWRRQMSGSYDEKDELGLQQTRAIEKIRNALLPIARYDVH